MVMAVLMENFVLLLLLPSFSNKACLNLASRGHVTCVIVCVTHWE